MTNPCLDYVLETQQIDEDFLNAWRIDYYEHHENPDLHDGNHEEVVEVCSICAAFHDAMLEALNAYARSRRRI